MKPRLGMQPGELQGRPYAEFWKPDMAPLSNTARRAIEWGSLKPEAIPELSAAANLLEEETSEVEDGLAVQPDGALHLAIRTEMPDVTPEMIDWWFGWHSAEPQRYKLWHPEAHVHASWIEPDPPGLSGRERYVGRTSIVDEFVGPREGRYAIQFVPPEKLGLKPIRDAMKATAVCARVGFADVPVDIGYLVHHVIAVPGGAVMRSRFWIGGWYAAGRNSRVGDIAVRAARLVLKPPQTDLLVHCSQEMTHLARFLPALYARCRELH